jgi:hypothetical protein
VANKDFVVKNSLVVGDTATINGVQVDPSNAISGQVLKFDGTKFAPASEGDISGTVYTATIGDGTNSSYTITHGFATRNVVVVIRNAASPYEVINARWEATTTNTITVDFSSPVTSDSVIVSVYGAVTGVSTGSSYYQTIGNGTDSSFTLTHNFNTRDVVVTARNAVSPYEVINARWEAETANTVVLDFSVAPSSSSVRVGVYATVSGTAPVAIDDLGDVTITSATNGNFLKYNGSAWVNDSIDLGTDTIGNYISNISAGTGIAVSHTPAEGSTATISIESTAWTSYTPTMTADGGGFALNNGTLTGRYKQVGKTVFFSLKFVFGSTTSPGAGHWNFGLPVTAYDSNFTFSAAILDDTVAWYGGIGNGNYTGSTSSFAVIIPGTNASVTTWAVVGNGGPFLWTTNDNITITGSYEAA